MQQLSKYEVLSPLVTFVTRATRNSCSKAAKFPTPNKVKTFPIISVVTMSLFSHQIKPTYFIAHTKCTNSLLSELQNRT